MTEITKGDWIIDSGASCHMTNQIHTGIMVDNNIPDIFVADGKNIAVAGVGDIKVNLQVHRELYTGKGVIHPGFVQQSTICECYNKKWKAGV